MKMEQRNIFPFETGGHPAERLRGRSVFRVYNGLAVNHSLHHRQILGNNSQKLQSSFINHLV